MHRCLNEVTKLGMIRLVIGFSSVVSFFGMQTNLSAQPARVDVSRDLQPAEAQAGIIPQAQDVADEDIEEKLEEFPDEGNRGAWAFPRMDRQTLRESLFGALGGSEAAFQKLKRESIRREVDRINSICNLSEEQLRKLDEAIEVDIQHISTRIESILSGYDPKLTMQELQVLHQEVYTFASTVNTNSNNAGGVWKKVLHSQLSSEQTKKMAEDERMVVANKQRTKQMHLLLSLQRRLGLNASQRLKISQWLALEKREQLDFPAICKAIAQTSELVEILSETQIKTLTSPPAKAIIIESPIEAIQLR